MAFIHVDLHYITIITRIVIIITMIIVLPIIRTGHFFIQTFISITVSAAIDITTHTVTIATVVTGIDCRS